MAGEVSLSLATKVFVFKMKGRLQDTYARTVILHIDGESKKLAKMGKK